MADNDLDHTRRDHFDPDHPGINKVKDKDTLRDAARDGRVTADTPKDSPVTDADLTTSDPKLRSDKAQVEKHPDDVNKDGT